MRKFIDRLLPAARLAAGRHGRDSHRAGDHADHRALHAAVPALDLDRGDGAVPVHLDGHAGRHGRRPRRFAFRSRRVARAEAASANALLRIVSNIFVLVFALVFIWYGIKFVQFGWDQSSELAEMPMTWIFVAWPLAGFTWVLFLGEWFIKDLRLIFADRVSPLTNVGKPRL